MGHGMNSNRTPFSELCRILDYVRDAGYECRLGEYLPLVEITDPIHSLENGLAVIRGERKVQICTMQEAISFVEARA